MFFLLIIMLSIATACLPLIAPQFTKLFPKLKLHPASAWLPVLAGILMVISTQLPNIHISNETSTFQQHFTGGGMYSAALYLYAKQLLNWRLHWFVNLLALFAWVSALGVANKLVEFALLKFGLASINTSDAYWDLLANTLGGLVGYLMIYRFDSVPKRD